MKKVDIAKGTPATDRNSKKKNQSDFCQREDLENCFIEKKEKRMLIAGGDEGDRGGKRLEVIRKNSRLQKKNIDMGVKEGNAEKLLHFVGFEKVKDPGYRKRKRNDPGM